MLCACVSGGAGSAQNACGSGGCVQCLQVLHCIFTFGVGHPVGCALLCAPHLQCIWPWASAHAVHAHSCCACAGETLHSWWVVVVCVWLWAGMCPEQQRRVLAGGAACSGVPRSALRVWLCCCCVCVGVVSCFGHAPAVAGSSSPRSTIASGRPTSSRLPSNSVLTCAPAAALPQLPQHSCPAGRLACCCRLQRPWLCAACWCAGTRSL